MKSIFFLCTFITAFQIASAQTTASEKPSALADTSKIFEIVENQPEFPGGVNAMIKFISSNVKYPKKALDKKIEGTVVIQFIVEKDGTLTNLDIIRDPGGGLGKEGLRVVKLMPNWKPGSQKGKNVRVKMSAPIRFRITK